MHISQQFVHTVPLDVVKRPALAVLVNFGLVAGRRPTRRELEELAGALRAAVPFVTIVDEQRLEVGEELEVLMEDVRIEVSEGALAARGADAGEVQAQVMSIADHWLSRCAGDPGAPETLAERIARQAVVGDEPPPGPAPDA